MDSAGLPIGLPAAKFDVGLGLRAGRDVGFELFGASMVLLGWVRGRICLGAPRWVAALWMRLAIKPIAMRLEKN
jgi:hypothetical protein